MAGVNVSSLWVQSCNLQGHSCGETDYATRPQLLSRRIKSTSRRQSHCVAFPSTFPLGSSNAIVSMCFLSFSGKPLPPFVSHFIHSTDLTSLFARVWIYYFIFHYFFFKRKVRENSRVKSPGSRERVGPLLSETFSLLPDVHQPSLLSFSPSFLSFFFFYAVVAGIRLSGRLYIAGHSGGDDLPWR